MSHTQYTKLFRIRFFTTIAALAFIPYIAKSGSPQNEPAAVKARIATINFEIETYNKELSCVGDGECEVLELGTGPCGGPSKYLVYSTANPQAATLKAKAQDYTLAEKQLRAVDFQMVSHCQAPPQPEARCVKNVCTDSSKKKDKN